MTLSLLLLLAFLTSEAASLTSNPIGFPQTVTNEICNRHENRSHCEVEIDVPEACSGFSNCPILFFLFDAKDSSDYQSIDLDSRGIHENKYIGIYPQSDSGWNVYPKIQNNCNWDNYECTSDANEGLFFADIIAYVKSQGANGNLYLIGKGIGASLAFQLASNAGKELPIKGIVAKSAQLLKTPERSGPGLLNYNQPSYERGSASVSILSIMGTADEIIPYNGGDSTLFNGYSEFEFMSGHETISTFALQQGCTGESSISGFSTNRGDGMAILRNINIGCPPHFSIQHYVISQGTHDLNGAIIDGKLVDYQLAYEFIEEVEGLPEKETQIPSDVISFNPTVSPSMIFSALPTDYPSSYPMTMPSTEPSYKPTAADSSAPSNAKSLFPTQTALFPKSYVISYGSNCQGQVDWSNAVRYYDIPSAQLCQSKCSNMQPCQSFQWNQSSNVCIIFYYQVAGFESMKNNVCGFVEIKSGAPEIIAQAESSSSGEASFNLKKAILWPLIAVTVVAIGFVLTNAASHRPNPYRNDRR